jgi:hypothetical protein
MNARDLRTPRIYPWKYVRKKDLHNAKDNKEIGKRLVTITPEGKSTPLKQYLEERVQNKSASNKNPWINNGENL